MNCFWRERSYRIRITADSELRYPYEGSKTNAWFDRFEETALVLELDGMYAELPKRKPVLRGKTNLNCAKLFRIFIVWLNHLLIILPVSAINTSFAIIPSVLPIVVISFCGRDCWGISERSVRNYCSTGYTALVGKNLEHTSDAVKPSSKNAKTSSTSPLLTRLIEESLQKIRVAFTISSRLSLPITLITLREQAFPWSDAHDFWNGNYRCWRKPLFTLMTSWNSESLPRYRLRDWPCKDTHRGHHQRILTVKLLKTGNYRFCKDWFVVGDYKRLPNECWWAINHSPRKCC